MFWVFPFLLSVALVGAGSYEVDKGQSWERQNDGDICFMWGHRVALLGNTLWFTHGNYSFVSGDVNTPQPHLFSLEINNSTPVESIIPASSYQRYDLPGPPHPASNMEDTQTILWYSNNSLYSVFVTESDEKYGWGQARELLMFSATSDGQYPFEWHDTNVVPAEEQNASSIWILSEWGSEASVSVPENGLSFGFGGSSSLEAAPGLITLNASSPLSPNMTWWNNTVAGTSGVPIPLHGESEMVYVPYGEQGVLLMMGGYVRDPSGKRVNNDMSQISVYDITSTNWYVVTATGTAPDARRQFCAVVSAAPDQSSFQVTIFGGFDGAKTYFEDVWVLTVPSFNWINVTPKEDVEADSLPTSIGRAHHRCAIYNEAQMIVLGGSVNVVEGVPINEPLCLALYPPIRVLDTTTYTWKKAFNMSLNYTVPAAVTQVIGGNGQGGAVMKGPSKPFNDTHLNTIFAEPISTVVKTSSTPIPTQSLMPMPKPNTRAIAGGVIGGIAILVLVGATFFCLQRRKRANQMKVEGHVYGEESAVSLDPKYSIISGVGEVEGTEEIALPEVSSRQTERHDLHSEERPFLLPDSHFFFASPVSPLDEEMH